MSVIYFYFTFFFFFFFLVSSVVFCLLIASNLFLCNSNKRPHVLEISMICMPVLE